MKKRSRGVSREGVPRGLRRVVVVFMGPYSCLFWSICRAYAENGLLFFSPPWTWTTVCSTHATGRVHPKHVATNLFSPLRVLSWHLYTEIFPDASLYFSPIFFLRCGFDFCSRRWRAGARHCDMIIETESNIFATVLPRGYDREQHLPTDFRSQLYEHSINLCP
jgi:hypothetical protein